ncbi:MAG: hypothetical protein QXG00_08110 [Candidatus Woesearchaeota archaeon]
MTKNDDFYESYTYRGDDSRDIRVALYEIEYENVYHLKNLYWLMHEWFDIENFESLDHDGYFENLYWQKIKPDGSIDHHIWWRTIRVPKNNNYYRYFIKVDIQTLNIGKSEMMSRGKKYNVNQGDVIIRVEAYLQLDYNNKWKKHWLLKNFDTWYRRRFFKRYVEDLKKDLYKTVYRFQDTIKQYLELHTKFDLPKPFHPPKTL